MWFKVECDFFDHPKIEAIGEKAAFVFLRGLAYCVKHMTDGAIPIAVAHRWASKDTIKRLTTIQPGQHFPLWHNVRATYQIHDFLKHQKSREQMLEQRQKNADRIANWRKV